MAESGGVFRSFSSVQFSRSIESDSLQPHGMQHARLPCPSLTLISCSNSTHVHRVSDASHPSHPLLPLLLFRSLEREFFIVTLKSSFIKENFQSFKLQCTIFSLLVSPVSSRLYSAITFPEFHTILLLKIF